MNKICLECGDEFNDYKGSMKFCCKSCAMTYRNRLAVENGTHNLLSCNGGSEIARKSNYARIANGSHPFLTGNMTEDQLDRKAEGIKLARLREAEKGTHIWQSFTNRINNEYSRSISIVERDDLDSLDLYYAKVGEYLKIGWSRNSDYRSLDNREFELSDLTCILTADPYSVIDLEYQIKLRFHDDKLWSLTKSTELFQYDKLDEILEFINNYISSTTIENLKRYLR